LISRKKIVEQFDQGDYERALKNIGKLIEKAKEIEVHLKMLINPQCSPEIRKGLLTNQLNQHKSNDGL